MAKLSVVLFDNDNGLKYHLGEVEVQPDGTLTTFSSQFELSKEKFEVFATEVTQRFKRKEVFTYEINHSTNKAKKPKKSARKN